MSLPNILIAKDLSKAKELDLEMCVAFRVSRVMNEPAKGKQQITPIIVEESYSTRGLNGPGPGLCARA